MYRRPRTKCLTQLYDAGAEAANADGPCPYEPNRERGDGLRAWLWKQGFDDATDRIVVHSLV